MQYTLFSRSGFILLQKSYQYRKVDGRVCKSIKSSSSTFEFYWPKILAMRSSDLGPVKLAVSDRE